jgi:hypothetical protein
VVPLPPDFEQSGDSDLPRGGSAGGATSVPQHHTWTWERTGTRELKYWTPGLLDVDRNGAAWLSQLNFRLYYIEYLDTCIEY